MKMTMKNKKHNWFMFLFVLPFALFGAIVLYIGAKDQEAHKQKNMEQATFVEDSVEIIDEDTAYKISGSRLMTLSDSIHYFEDGL